MRKRQENDVSLPPVAGGTMGGLFRAAREARGIPIELAAHQTRIRTARLREIEADDLSKLAPSYARMFLMRYADYLGIPRKSIQPFLPNPDGFGTDGYQYIRSAASDSPLPHRPRKVRRAAGPLRAVAIGVAALVLAAAGIQSVVVLRKLERIRATAAEDRAAMLHSPETRFPEAFVAVGEVPGDSQPTLAGGSPPTEAN